MLNCDADRNHTKMLKHITLVSLLTLASTGLFAQQEVLTSQYMFNNLFLNPAYAGLNDHFTSTLLHRNQWAQFEGAPTTSLLGVDGSLANGKMGLGLTLLHDQIGATRDIEVAGQFAYHLQLNETQRLSFGIKAAMSMYTASLSGVAVWDPDDPTFQNDIYNTTFGKFGVGAIWSTETSFIGLSVPTLIAQRNQIAEQVAGGSGNLFDQHYYLNAGHLIPLNASLSLKPTVLLKYQQQAPLDIDINANVLYKEMVWFGLGWRSGDAVIAMLEYQVLPELRFGYAYDITTSVLGNFSSGSHELLIGFDMAKEQVKLKSPRYF